MLSSSIICFPHIPSSEGGPGTFQSNLEAYLRQNNYKVIYPNSKIRPDLIVVVAGTRKIFWLMLMKLRGVKILHRLDGMNWKYNHEKILLKNKLKQILQNLLIAFIRNYLADHIIYQSKFVENWWTTKFKPIKNSSIIINGSSFFENSRQKYKTSQDYTLTCIEGQIQNDKITTSILKQLDEDFKKMIGIKSIEIFGNHSQIKNLSSYKNLNFMGSIKRGDMKKTLEEKKRIFFLLELNPPCPNSMIESLCLGFPCIGFDSGSFKELLGEAGIAIPYEDDVWKLETPPLTKIKESINKISNNYEYYNGKALEISKKYEINIMLVKYEKVINRLLN
jgi:glycosyltransferase involved in cell wall biosynthesis